MKHAQSRALHSYWQTLRMSGTTPERADVEPQDIASLLGYVFMLRRIDQGHHVFRLAGTHFCQLYQREFRDQNFLSLWRGHDATHIQALLESTLAGASPSSVVARASSIDLHQLPVEISFFPLKGPEGVVDRVLGLYQPLDDVEDFANRPVVRTSLREIRPPAVPGHLFGVTASGREPNAELVANDR